MVRVPISRSPASPTYPQSRPDDFGACACRLPKRLAGGRIDLQAMAAGGDEEGLVIDGQIAPIAGDVGPHGPPMRRCQSIRPL